MKKLDGHICDVCRTVFRRGDHIVEMCEDCANTVWCLINVYEDGKRELSSIHRTEEKALQWMETNKKLFEKLHSKQDNKIVKQELTSWYVL